MHINLMLRILNDAIHYVAMKKSRLNAPKLLKLHSDMKDLCLYNVHEQVKLRHTQSQIIVFKFHQSSIQLTEMRFRLNF